MYPPQSYDPRSIEQGAYGLPPLRPDLFGALPQGDPQGGPPQAGGPQVGPPPPAGGSGGEPPMDMNQYLIDKVMEIKGRMGSGGVGALSAISNAMTQNPTQQAPVQGPPAGPPPQQPPMRS